MQLCVVADEVCHRGSISMRSNLWICSLVHTHTHTFAHVLERKLLHMLSVVDAALQRKCSHQSAVVLQVIAQHFDAFHQVTAGFY